MIVQTSYTQGPKLHFRMLDFGTRAIGTMLEEQDEDAARKKTFFAEITFNGRVYERSGTGLYWYANVSVRGEVRASTDTCSVSTGGDSILEACLAAQEAVDRLHQLHCNKSNPEKTP